MAWKTCGKYHPQPVISRHFLGKTEKHHEYSQNCVTAKIELCLCSNKCYMHALRISVVVCKG